tara:strand:+ start:1131 stop:2027 length:897 start_codon:yes stop_codon:yes gene_type:complete
MKGHNKIDVINNINYFINFIKATYESIKNMFNIYMHSKEKVAVIFDLDETIGHFWQVGKLWEGLKHLENRKFNEKDFQKILNLYPNVFRPEIFNILKYLRREKQKNKHLKVLIYSNNMGTPKWAQMIKKFIENKIGGKVFDKVITAWKVDGVIYEKCRSTNEKTYKDILNCGKFSKNTKIFFVDDTMHPKMKHNNVEYYYIEDYKFGYSVDNMVFKFLNSKICNKLSSKSKFNLEKNLAKYIRKQNWGYIRYTNSESQSKEEKELGMKLSKSIKQFLRKNIKKTRKREIKKSGTRRLY